MSRNRGEFTIRAGGTSVDRYGRQNTGAEGLIGAMDAS
jgi:hypothetical protein